VTGLQGEANIFGLWGNLLKQQSDHLLDARGGFVPVTLLVIRRALREMKPGEMMEILVDDPETREDLFKTMSTSLYELIDIKEDHLFSRIFLRKNI
jgi:tRNA 2-thiouridine synthesizing protein A